jgi:hypothetical protein
MGNYKAAHSKIPVRPAQASLELTALLGVFLIVILFYTVFASGLLSHIDIQGDYHDAYSSAQALASAADSVFASGEGTGKPVRVVLPTNFNASKSYIGRPSWASTVPPNTININMGGTDLFANTRAPVTGSFPSTGGEYVFSVVSHGTYVSINSYVIEVAPGAVYLYASPGSRREVTITVRSVSPELTDVNISAAWSFPHANLTITPERFVTKGSSEMPITLNFSVGSQAYGAHISELQITSKRNGSAGGDTESISIPITLEVGR